MWCVKGCAFSNISKSWQLPNLEASWLQFLHPPVSPIILSTLPVPKSFIPTLSLEVNQCFQAPATEVLPERLAWNIQQSCVTPAQPVSTLPLEHCKTAWERALASPACSLATSCAFWAQNFHSFEHCPAVAVPPAAAAESSLQSFQHLQDQLHPRTPNRNTHHGFGDFSSELCILLARLFYAAL